MLIQLDAGLWVDAAEIVTVAIVQNDDAAAVVRLRDGRELAVTISRGQAGRMAVEALVERINRARLEP